MHDVFFSSPRGKKKIHTNSYPTSFFYLPLLDARFFFLFLCCVVREYELVNTLFESVHSRYTIETLRNIHWFQICVRLTSLSPFSSMFLLRERMRARARINFSPSRVIAGVASTSRENAASMEPGSR